MTSSLHQKRVHICVTNDLYTDQRVHKVATSLQAHGFEPVLLGRLLPGSPPVKRLYKTHRMRLLFRTGPLFYLCYNLRLFFYLCGHRGDIILSNDLDSLLGASWAARFRGRTLIYDSHELFTEVPELVGRERQKKVWLYLEKRLLPRVHKAYTVCASIAQIYQQQYGVSFEVIRNLPQQKAVLSGAVKAQTPYILYQGALNLGRGIALMIQAMCHLKNLQLWIAGSGDCDAELHQLVDEMGLQDKVRFLGRLTPEALVNITQGALLGLSLEEDLGLNYRYALPNKLFDYIQAQIPVLVSDLPEMSAIVQQYGVGEIVKDREPEKLAKQIQLLLEDDAGREQMAKNARLAAGELSWEVQEKRLLALFEK